MDLPFLSVFNQLSNEVFHDFLFCFFSLSNCSFRDISGFAVVELPWDMPFLASSKNWNKINGVRIREVFKNQTLILENRTCVKSD